MKCSECGAEIIKTDIIDFERHFICEDCDTHHDEDGDAIHVCSHCGIEWIVSTRDACDGCYEYLTSDYS